MEKNMGELSEEAKRLRVTVEVITPEIAAAFLEKAKGFRNRKIKDYAVNKLVRRYVGGHFKANGESIIFDQSDVLLDGQHRLLACVRSGVTIESVVVRGVSRSAFETIDTSVGGSRHVTDWLSVKGYSSTNTLASVVGLIMRYENRKLSRTLCSGETPSWEDVEKYLIAHPTIPDVALEASSKEYRGDKTISPRFVGFAIYILDLTGSDPTTVRDFVSSLCAGVNLSEGSPILAVRRMFVSARLKHVNVPESDSVRAIITAWNAWSQGEKRVHIKRTRRMIDNNGNVSTVDHELPIPNKVGAPDPLR